MAEIEPTPSKSEYVRMHAIASAIAGSLRTSAAPTGSRPLPPPGFPPPGLDAQPSRGGRRGGRSIQLLGYQLSSGLTRRLPRFIPLSYRSLGRGDGRDLSGWPVQLRVYAVAHSGSAAGSPVQLRAYAVAAQRNAAGPLQVSSSRSVEQWPRLPLCGRSTCGSTR